MKVYSDVSISADGYLGAGERLFDGVPPLQLEILAARAASLTTHVSYRVLH
jgi:hypothetical protein